QLRQQVEEFTHHLAALQQHQPQLDTKATDDEPIHSFNPFAAPMASARADDRHWEAGFKVEIPEFHGELQPSEFLYWLHKVEEILDFKEVLDHRRVPLITIRL
ncbi:hypothetical protein Pfo_005394, partial [Paulownia fortunei]